MKSLKTLTLCICTYCVAIFAQSNAQNKTSDEQETKEFVLGRLIVAGEVENPGSIDLNKLPQRSAFVKELGIEQEGKNTFKGAFFYSGYSLYDILNLEKIKKSNGKEFSSPVDLYVIVENDGGEKTVFSWGEICYSKDNFSIFLSKSVQAVNPSKVKAHWTLPENPRIICTNDHFNVRFIENPTRITVKSFAGTFATEKPKDIFSPEIKFVKGPQISVIRQIGPAVERRTYTNVGYGHGTGFKGVQSVVGYLLKDVLTSVTKFEIEDSRKSIAVVSAKDGYRAVFSVNEILNRNDNQDFLLIDTEKTEGDGRYSLFAAPDFFVDRNVKAIEKIEIIRVD